MKYFIYPVVYTHIAYFYTVLLSGRPFVER